ncbi:MAG: GTP-binding protein [Thermoplasmata archaeon HGW-Thermoplasmata-2]|nr:MAG: GTP-binding protein [Thermoplasmata archaeon HGW-Thermoplasmata-2]
MGSIEDQIKELEDEYSKTEKNKKTEIHRGKLRAKIARLRELAEKRASKGGGGGQGYAFKKSGSATVAMVGFPSVGKSTIMNRITNVFSEVAAYDFTTLTVVPGVLEYSGARIQILDLPGIIKGAAHGKGRGREVLSVVRSADLIMFMCDPFNAHTIDVLLKELYEVGMRVNTRKPDVVVRKTSMGGIEIHPTVKLTKLSEGLIKEVLREYGYVSAEIVLREDIDVEQLIDVLAGNRLYVKAFVVVNKIDLADPVMIERARGILKNWKTAFVSGDKQIGLEELKKTIYGMLDFVRVYLKPQGEDADLKEPMVVRNGTTIEGICNMLHKEFVKNFRYALVWGKSARFPGQTVGKGHVLADKDILSIMIKKSAGLLSLVK